MSHFITTHDENNMSLFSKTVPEARHHLKFPGAELQMIYSGHSYPPHPSDDTEIKQYAQDRQTDFPGGELTPIPGFYASIVSFPPGHQSGGPMHRSLTLDILIVLEGEFECVLDSGESRILKQGDSITQRGTMHQWKNVSENESWLRFMTFNLSLQRSFIVNGESLEPVYSH
ncbi:hypothetical protein NW762_007110 [Fusarium torreyae]|uniref:Cupin type-2 domain-containing protein n=1 Tax=Fusarium torreyae TaxID=1237075 RepID=A0A9W8RYU5_9HYPO|nr:hypothetical protein NW762_007110 [Fusarium torreyae]